MSLTRKFISPLASGMLSSPLRRDLRRRLAETRRRLGGEPHRIDYFHQLDDPYSHLLAQALVGFLDSHDVQMTPHLVGPPSDAAAPDRGRLIAYSRKDAADIAPHHGLDFVDPGGQPRKDLIEVAGRVLAGALRSVSFADLASRVGTALWAGDAAGLEALAREAPPAGPGELASATIEGERLRTRLGHYLGATLFYGGEWYWGVDRLHYLEARLAALGARREGAAAAAVASPTGNDGNRASEPGPRVKLEFFASLRSPYTYISMPRVFELPRRHPLDLVLRPVLPMVMRGLAVPWPKRFYILLDTKREAEQIGMPFGRVADPVGRPVERGYSLFPWAREQGKGADYLLSFARAAFADGVDTGSESGLRKVVERAGLPWSEGRAFLDDDGWRGELEENRKAMLDLGLWGVPSFRLSGPSGEPAFCTWGQDRLWLVEEQIRRRLS